MEWVPPVIQLVTAGGFGGLVWYLVVKHIPAIHQLHAVERKEWMAMVQKREEAFDSLSGKNIEALAKVEKAIEQLWER